MSPNRLLRQVPWLVCGVSLLLSHSIYGETTRPAPPQEYDVEIRFRLRATTPRWFDLFDEMLADLKKIGFQRAPRPAGEAEDPEADRLIGTIASQNARKLLLSRYTQTIVLAPRGWKAPTDADKRVKVDLELATGLPAERQHVLSNQCLQQLEQIGFRNAVGYDHRGFTRLFGTIDAYHFGNLIRDLRTEPAGWLIPRTAINALPTPLRNVVPIRVVEVLPEPSDMPPAQEAAPLPTFPEGQTHLAKIRPDLQAMIAAEKDEQRRLRVEVILADPPKDDDRNWERELRLAAVGSAVEGRLGTVVTVLVRTVQIPELARPASVLAVRLPIQADAQLRLTRGNTIDALAETRLGRFHQLGYRGYGVKIAVIAGDFGGYERFVGNRLGKGTRLIDFTRSRNTSLLPDPMPSDDGRVGQGTLYALAVQAAAPQAPLLLLRVDPAAPHQVLMIARMLNRDEFTFELLEERRRELDHERDTLSRRADELQEERRKAVEGLVFEQGESKLPELKKRYEESQARLKRVQQNIELLQKDRAEHQQRVQRLLAAHEELGQLEGIRVVACPLVWNDGYPLDGTSELSRYFDETPFVGYPGDKSRSKIASLRHNRNTLWVQAAGDTRGQTWTGQFRDDDQNGVMEFAPASAPLAQGRWTSELSFLAWQPFDGAQVADLPEKVRIRVSLQWREPHDADVSQELDDPYRESLVNLNMLALRQRDHQGTKLATDDLEVLGRTTGRALRLQRSPSGGTYEQILEFDATAGGRIALRVEGRVPEGIRPASYASLAGQRRRFELRPRIFVEVLDAAARAKGRVVLLDYPGSADWPPAEAFQTTQSFGGVGMPADAANVLTVGAAGPDGKSTASSAVGAGPGRQLLVKPNLLGFGSLDLGDGLRAGGSGAAASFNAGLAACLIGSSAPAQPHALLQLLQLPPGTVLRIPEAWFGSAKNR